MLNIIVVVIVVIIVIITRWRREAPHAALSTILMAGRQLNPSQATHVMARWGRAYLMPKDANAAVGVYDCATQKVPERYDRHTDKQTNKLSEHYGKIRLIGVVACVQGQLPPPP